MTLSPRSSSEDRTLRSSSRPSSPDTCSSLFYNTQQFPFLTEWPGLLVKRIAWCKYIRDRSFYWALRLACSLYGQEASLGRSQFGCILSAQPYSEAGCTLTLDGEEISKLTSTPGYISTLCYTIYAMSRRKMMQICNHSLFSPPPTSWEI